MFKFCHQTALARGLGLTLGAAAWLLSKGPAFADGFPVAWGTSMQDPGSPIQSNIDSFHDLLLWIISGISIFVLLLLLYVIVRFNRARNPTASTRTHHIPLEIAWTVVPCLILIGLLFISFPLLYYTDRVPTPDLTLKVTGHQWYWSYEFADTNDITFDSHAIWDSSKVTPEQANKLLADAEPGWLIKNTPMRLLEVDNRLVLPVGKVVRVEITATDVEHSWYLPSLGVNRMAVPGRISELWLKVQKEGIYYGQCSMICGNGHGFMPIVIEGVAPDAFAAWVQAKKTASNGQGVVKENYAGLEKGR